VLDKIFGPFFTTKEPGKGTGLGLSNCARHRQEPRRVVQVQTEVTREHLQRLSAGPGKYRDAPADVAPVDLATGSGQLLLAVDDEAAVLTMTKENVETFGYRVITAQDGAEAVPSSPSTMARLPAC